MKFPISESEIQESIIKDIKQDSLIKKLNNIKNLESRLLADNNNEFIPSYLLDFKLKSKYSKEALEVIKSLDLIEIVTGEKIQNISLQKDTKAKRERLYPDIVLANQEEVTFSLIELKKSRQTEREAVTELLAYAFELKNHLPNIADDDINLIIISSDFNTLLDHAVSSLVLGSKFKVLAIKIDFDSELKYEIYTPKGWTDIWQHTLPEHSFISLTLEVYSQEGKEDIPDNDSIIAIAEDLIMFEGAKHNSHGFYVIWKNSLKDFGENSLFGITIYQMNPFVFLQSSIDMSFRLNSKEPLSKYILNMFDEIGPDIHSNSLSKASGSVKKFLDKFFYVRYEDFSSWTNHSHSNSHFKHKTIPITFNAWGDIGEYLRYFYFHPATKKIIHKNQLNSSDFYRNPVFGIEIINRISGLVTFSDGIFNASSLFKYALELRKYELYSSYFFENKKGNFKYKLLEGRLFHSAINIIASQREVYSHINSIKEDLTKTIKPFKIFFDEVLYNQTQEIFDYVEWFVTEFLKNHPLYQFLFKNIYDFAILFIDDLKDVVDSETINKCENSLIMIVKEYLIDFLTSQLNPETKYYSDNVSTIIKDVFFRDKKVDFKSENIIKKLVDNIPNALILDNFEPNFLIILDFSNQNVHHELHFFSKEFFQGIDWLTMKEQSVKRFQEGFKYCSLIIEPNGNLYIGVLPEEYRVLEGIKKPNEEVFLYLNHGAIQTAIKVKWKDVESGIAFEPFL